MMRDVTRPTRTELGRIQKAAFGWGGYQDAQFGLSITIGGKSWGCGDFKGDWGIERSDHCKWSEEDRLQGLGKACIALRDILKAAGVQTVDQLAGVPIEATFNGTLLVSWRVLDEVL
jgi:hypothetical protein